MTENVTGAPTESLDSPTKADAQPAASSPAPDATAESSTEGAQETFNQRVAELEGNAPEKKESSPDPEKTTESEAQPEADAKKDEPAPDKGKAPDDTALSQSQDEALNKAFHERPEWKKALRMVPKEKEADMRDVMRSILGREKEAVAQVEEKFKPVVQKFERFRKSVGDDRAVDNTIELTELFQRGDPKAREMLVTLLNDLDTRTGAVLTSKDLLDRSADIKRQLDDGTITQEVADQRKADLLEIQKARAGKQSTESAMQQRERDELQQRFQSQQTELTSACESWEGEKMKSDPDYPSLKSLVEQRAFVIGTERQEKLKGRLLSGTEMKAVLDDALAFVKAEAAKLRPPPKAHQPITGTGSSATSRRAATTPKEKFDQRIDELEAKL